jgi:hypothetical protein
MHQRWRHVFRSRSVHLMTIKLLIGIAVSEAIPYRALDDCGEIFCELRPSYNQTMERGNQLQSNLCIPGRSLKWR